MLYPAPDEPSFVTGGEPVSDGGMTAAKEISPDLLRIAGFKYLPAGVGLLKTVDSVNQAITSLHRRNGYTLLRGFRDYVAQSCFDFQMAAAFKVLKGRNPVPWGRGFQHRSKLTQLNDGFLL